MAYITVDYYPETIYEMGDTLSLGGKTKIGQSFTGKASKLTSCKFYLYKFGSPTGNAVAKLYAHTGEFGVSSSPTGDALATSDNFDVSTLTEDIAWATFTFSGANQYTMVEGTKYVITIEYPGIAGLNWIYVGYQGEDISPTHTGNWVGKEDAGDWFADGGRDNMFYVYGEAGASPATKIKKNPLKIKML